MVSLSILQPDSNSKEYFSKVVTLPQNVNQFINYYNNAKIDFPENFRFVISSEDLDNEMWSDFKNKCCFKIKLLLLY